MLRGVAKQMMYASLLSQVRQGHEEAGFTHPHAITLTVMSRAVSPVRLQHTELFAVPRHSHGGTTDVARHIGVSVVWYVHARQYLTTHQKIFNTVVSSALLRAPGPASTYRVLRVLKMHPSANSISCVVRTQSPSWKRFALSYNTRPAYTIAGCCPDACNVSRIASGTMRSIQIQSRTTQKGTSSCNAAAEPRARASANDISIPGITSPGAYNK